MALGDNVVFRINPKVERPAKILKQNEDGTDDISVFLHPDDYPEFSKAACAAGTAVVRGVKEGPGNGQYSYPK